MTQLSHSEAIALSRRRARAPARVEPVHDGALIARSLRAAEAFSAVFDRHWSPIHRFCVSRSGAAGEDIAAEVFRVAFDGRSRFDTARADAAPWLYGIATNLMRHHFRSAERGRIAVLRSAPVQDADPADDALGRIEAAQLGPRLAAALGAIGANERDALLLHAWAELTYEEIALATGVPIGTVRSRINRARERVRAHLATTGGDTR